MLRYQFGVRPRPSTGRCHRRRRLLPPGSRLGGRVSLARVCSILVLRDPYHATHRTAGRLTVFRSRNANHETLSYGPPCGDDDGATVLLATGIDCRSHLLFAYAVVDNRGDVVATCVTDRMNVVWRGGPAPACESDRLFADSVVVLDLETPRAPPTDYAPRRAPSGCIRRATRDRRSTYARGPLGALFGRSTGRLPGAVDDPVGLLPVPPACRVFAGEPRRLTAFCGDSCRCHHLIWSASRPHTL